MSTINTTLNNFCHVTTMMEVFSEFPHDYEFDENGVLRRSSRPCCVKCGKPLNKNGYNSYTKKGLGTIRVGRWSHSECNTYLEEDRTFWETLSQEFFRYLAELTLVLRRHHLSYSGMSEVFSFIFPRGRETTRTLFLDHMNHVEFPEQRDILIVHYDEQHPKKGRAQKFRLTLMNGSTKEPIADELLDSKSPETILDFLGRHLDPTQPVFIVTDFYKSYPAVFETFFVNGFHHQKCLLHLNKLIVKEFPRHCSMADELLKYEILNIFYDRSKEIRYLKKRVLKERQMKERYEYRSWLKKTKQAFRQYLRKLENSRRRKKRNLLLRTHNGSVRMLNRLMQKYNTYPKNIQKRLRMIRTNWNHLTAFHNIEGAPATNNVVENYYSASLKSHQKRQYTSERGIVNQMKLARLKRLGRLGRSKWTIPELLHHFSPFSVKPG
jgi:hypothetical protein